MTTECVGVHVSTFVLFECCILSFETMKVVKFLVDKCDLLLMIRLVS
jgi:hypothetical protein